MGRVWTLRLQAILDASPARVYALITDPTQIPRWWGPHGFTTPGVDYDLRVGGRYRFTMQPPDGETFHLSGEFTEIVPGERISYTFAWEEPDPDDVETLVTLTLLPDGDGQTQLSLEHGEFSTEARLELHRGGWSDGFERLADVVADGAP